MDSGGPREACVSWEGGAHWRHLANTIEPSMCGGDAASLSNYFDRSLVVLHYVDYGNSLFEHAPKIWTDKLQRVVNATGRIISDTRKFDRGLKRFLHEDLHWLDVPQRVTYKLCLLVFKCLHGLAPQYLAELCVPVADVTPRRKLRSATRSDSRTTGFSSVQHEKLETWANAQRDGRPAEYR